MFQSKRQLYVAHTLKIVPFIDIGFYFSVDGVKNVLQFSFFMRIQEKNVFLVLSFQSCCCYWPYFHYFQFQLNTSKYANLGVSFF